MYTLLKINIIKRILLWLQSQASSLEFAVIEAVQGDFLVFKSLKFWYYFNCLIAQVVYHLCIVTIMELSVQWQLTSYLCALFLL